MGATGQPKINVLFLCSRNKWRSPTAEKVFSADPRLAVRSRGTSRQSVRRLTSADLKWADVVLVMEKKHKQRVVSDFPGEARFKPIHVLDIQDDYQFMDEELVDILTDAVPPYLSA